MTIQPICAVASGSGGHIIPCITLARHQAYLSHQPLLFIGNSQALDTTIHQHYPGISTTAYLTLPKVPYRQWWKLPLFAIQVATTFFKSIQILHKEKPSVVISTGGYLSIPVCLAAALLRIPIDLFELNAQPGRTTQLIAPLTTRLFICFKETQRYFKKQAILASYPLRFTAQEKKPVTPDKPTLLILGGSQGSTFLNTMFEKSSIDLLRSWRIIHQTGTTDQKRVEQFYTQHGIEHTVFAFYHQLADYYNQASLIICRAGAGSIFETLFFEKPCIIIPLSTTTTNHQKYNAYASQHDHPDLVTVLLQEQITQQPNLLQETILKKLEIHQEPAFDSSVPLDSKLAIE